MNGVVEETGKVATGVVEGLRTQPLALALVVVNVLFLGVGVWFISQIAERTASRDKMISDLVRNCAQQPTNGKD